MISFKEYIVEMTESDWNFTKVGKVDGKSHGMGGDVSILKGTHKNTNKDAWFIKHPKTNKIRMVTADHPLIKKHKFSLKESEEPKDPALPLKVPPFKPWQDTIMRKSGSVKPGHWNGKKFISDLSKQDAPGFDHDRCKSINAQIEIHGKVIAGGIQKQDE